MGSKGDGQGPQERETEGIRPAHCSHSSEFPSAPTLNIRVLVCYNATRTLVGQSHGHFSGDGT